MNRGRRMDRRHTCPITIGAAMLALGSSPAMAVRLDYVLDAGVERNDNLTLSDTDPISQNILRGGSSFLLSQDSAVLQASVIGRIEYSHYSDDLYDDTVDGTLSGRLNWSILPQRLAFTIQDNLSRQAINTLAPDIPGNRQQLNVLSLGPTLFFSLGPSWQGQAELRYVDSEAEVTDEFNSQRLTLAVATTKEIDPVSRASFNAVGQRVDFDVVGAARNYGRFDVFARYERNLTRFDLGVDAGYSLIDYRDDSERRYDPLFRTDIGWRQSERSLYTLNLRQQFTDVTAEAMSSIDIDAALPGSIPTGTAVVNASPYEERYAGLEYAFTGVRTSFAVTPYIDQLDYIDSDEFDQDGRGLSVELTRLLNPRLTFGVYAVAREIDYRLLDREDETRRYGVNLRYEWSRHWSTRLEWTRYERISTVAGENATQNTLYLSMVYYNR